MNTMERVGVERKEMDLAALVWRALAQGAPRGIFITDICEDSRKVSPGALFVAVPGTKVDGTSFIADAVARGAAAIVVDQSTSVETHTPCIRVPDARAAVAKLAAAYYGLADIQNTERLRIAGVTGTNGKSTFAFMLRRLLSLAGRQPALLGTIEYDLVSRRLPSDLTTPDAISLTKYLMEAHASGATDAVMEVSSHSLEQHRADGINFSIAVFTNLTQDHLDYHGNLDNYLIAKKRLFDGLASNATAIINAHDPASSKIVGNCSASILRYGTTESSDVRGTILREDRDGGRFLLEFNGQGIEIHTPLVGRHNIFNALSAAAAALAANIDLKTIQRGLTELEYVPGRLQRVSCCGLGFDVFVDYAHTDDALRNVLSALRPLTTGRLWCVFGCGGDRDRSKRPKMARAVAERADSFVITSDNPRTEDPYAILADIERGLSSGSSAPEVWGLGESSHSHRNSGDSKAKVADHDHVTIPDRARAIQYAIEHLAPGDTLIIAGKGHENYQIIGTCKNHFDDIEVATDAIRRLACSERRGLSSSADAQHRENVCAR